MPSPLIDDARSLGEAARLWARLGVRDRRWMSALARSNELRGWRGERGVAIMEVGTCGGLGKEKDIDLSDVGVESSMTGGIA